MKYTIKWAKCNSCALACTCIMCIYVILFCSQNLYIGKFFPLITVQCNLDILMKKLISTVHWTQTFIRWSTLASSWVLTDRRQYNLSPGLATNLWANSLWNISTAHLAKKEDQQWTLNRWRSSKALGLRGFSCGPISGAWHIWENIDFPPK